MQFSHQTCIGEVNKACSCLLRTLTFHIIWIYRSICQRLSLPLYDTHPTWLSLTNELQICWLALKVNPKHLCTKLVCFNKVNMRVPDALAPCVARSSANMIDWPCSLTQCRISTTCAMSMWGKDIKCKYMFMLPLNNLPCKGFSGNQEGSTAKETLIVSREY